MTPSRVSKQIELFAIRTSELADRVAHNEIDFLDAVDMAASAAIWSGLADAIGIDATQKIMAAAFANSNSNEEGNCHD
jgi:hypothetical protein